MFENLKINSTKLNAAFRITIFLPNDYDKNNNIYNTLYIVSGSNPFINKQYKLEDALSSKNMLGIAIYPNLDITKNRLLYNSFDDKFNYASIYEEFIINDLIPLLESKYRISKNQSGNAILGIKDTAILAYSLAYHYTENFDKVLLHDFNISNHKLFMSDLMSKFDPNISFNFSSSDSTLKDLIVERLKMFGSPSINTYDLNVPSLLKAL